MPLGVSCRRPADAIYQPATGQWHRPVTRLNAAGQPIVQSRICCEECWETMPAYAEAPSGYVSPDSNTKLRTTLTEGRSSVEALEKVVCYDCWRTVFERVAPAGIETPAWDHRLRE